MTTEMPTNMLDTLDFTSVDNVSTQLVALPRGESFSSVALSILRGDMDLTLGQTLSSLLSPLFQEVGIMAHLLRDMVIIAILSAVLSALAINLKNKSVSDMGFYVVYIIVIALLLDSFLRCVRLMQGFSDDLSRIVEASVPLMTSLILLSGNPASAAVLNPIAMVAAGLMQFVLRDIIAPVLIFTAVLEIVNYMSAREALSKLVDLVKKAVKVSLVVLTGLFAGVLMLQRVSAPIADGAAVRMARYGVGAIPVVGQALSGAVNVAVYWSDAVKNSVLTTVIIVIVFMCLPVILKITAFILAYKITAAIIQPICDKRVVNAVNTVGSLASLVLAACALAAMSFIFMVMVMISL